MKLETNRKIRKVPTVQKHCETTSLQYFTSVPKHRAYTLSKVTQNTVYIKLNELLDSIYKMKYLKRNATLCYTSGPCWGKKKKKVEGFS